MRFIKTLALSTAHITEQDGNQLYAISKHGNGDLIVINGEYNWTVIVLGGVIDTKEYELSDAFWHIMYLANCEGCDRIEFDRDEEKDPNLQTFEW